MMGHTIFKSVRIGHFLFLSHGPVQLRSQFPLMVSPYAKEAAIMTEQERIAEFRRLEASINPLDLRGYLLALQDSAYTAGPPPADQEAKT